MARTKTLSKNLNAFLDTLGWSEGTITSPLTKDDGYDVIVTGIDENGKSTPEVFTDYNTHPFANGRKSKKINSKGLTSNASGRYQHMLKDFKHYRDLLKLDDKTKFPGGAFSPEAQDAWAIQLIKERRALVLIERGYIKEAITYVSNLWASLPGANYKDQMMHSMDKLIAVYISKGGTLWESKSSLVESSPSLPVSSVPLNLEVSKQKPNLTQTTESNTITPKPQGFWSLIKKLLKSN